jgi:hypothetical protein
MPTLVPVKANTIKFLAFRLQCSIERIFFDTGGMSTIQCALCSSFAAKFSTNARDYAVSNQVAVKSNIITVLPMLASTFNWTYLPAIGGLSTTRCVLYHTFAAKYRAQYQVYAMSSLVPVKYNTITFLDIEASMFNRTYLLCNWLIIDKSLRDILLICCQTIRVSSSFRYAKMVPVK